MSDLARIPKVIYTFWHSEDIPKLIELCLSTWKYFNPNYEIILMNLNNYQQYCSFDLKTLRHLDPNNPTRMTDFIRLEVLKNRGGIWMDPSTICTASLDSIINKKVTELAIYATDIETKYPIVESWFIAGIKGNEFIGMWHQELVVKSNNFKSFKDYVKNALKGLDKSSKWWKSSLPFYYEFGRKRLSKLTYFGIHVAAQVVIQKQEYKFNKTNIIDANPPLKYAADMQGLCEGLATGRESKPIIKLTKNDRIYIDQHPEIKDQLFGLINSLMNSNYCH